MSTDFEITILGTRLNNSASFKISEFKNAIGNLARPNLFYADLSPGDSLLGYMNSAGISIDNTFQYRCETAEFPGRTIATMDDAVGAGPALKLPYDVTYNDISMTIICSEDMNERQFFELWMDVIVGKADSGHGGLINYYDNYATGNILAINQVDSSGDILSTWNLFDVYPIALTPMTASWEDSNTYQRFGVTLSYRYYSFVVSDKAVNQRI